MPIPTISSLVKGFLSSRGALALTGVLLCSSAEGHSWYPKDCCDDADCAPVERISQFVRGTDPSRAHPIPLENIVGRDVDALRRGADDEGTWRLSPCFRAEFI